MHPQSTAQQTAIDLSHEGVDRILAALAEAGQFVHYNETDGDTFLDVWLTDLGDTAATILSWRDNGEGWLLRSWESFSGDSNDTPDRKWPITAGSPAEVARDVASILTGSEQTETAEQPGLTAATTAGRALLAAGWRYDSTSPMADYTTIRTLLHPSGREIHARTVDGGEQTALTMTGLTLAQVAGAINGAGLAPTEPASDARQVAWQLVINGIAGGLPIPDSISIPSGYHIFEVKVADNDHTAAEAWASYLNLPRPSAGTVIQGNHRDFRNYGSESWEHPAMPGWKVEVSSYIDEPVEGGADR